MNYRLLVRIGGCAFEKKIALKKQLEECSMEHFICVEHTKQNNLLKIFRFFHITSYGWYSEAVKRRYAKLKEMHGNFNESQGIQISLSFWISVPVIDPV